MDPAREPFALGDWQVDAPGNRLLRGSEVRPLRHKAMALLVLLARHPGRTALVDDTGAAQLDREVLPPPRDLGEDRLSGA